MVLDNNGNVYGVGFNKYGQLGVGDTEDKNIFTIINPNL